MGVGWIAGKPVAAGTKRPGESRVFSCAEVKMLEMGPTNMRRLGIAFAVVGVVILLFFRGKILEGWPLAWRGWTLLVCGIAIAIFPKTFKWEG